MRALLVVLAAGSVAACTTPRPQAEPGPDKLVKDQVPVPDTIEDLKNYGMHRHFTDAGCVLLFGGGMKRGHLHGLTADELVAVGDPRARARLTELATEDDEPAVRAAAGGR